MRRAEESTPFAADRHGEWAQPRPGPLLSVIVPTFNEAANIPQVVQALAKELDRIPWEVIFVDDDSPDRTVMVVRQIAREDSRVRCIHRLGRRGLSSACIEGMLASSAPFIAVMDGDLQHDPSLLPKMLMRIERDGLDVVVGSRFERDGGYAGWDLRRIWISQFATRLSRLIIPAELNDPMSGFFIIRRHVLDDCVRNLSGLGFKLLVDIFASSKHPLRFANESYIFRMRQQGESKFDTQAAWDFGMLLLDKTIGRYIPTRFVAFSIVGGAGIFVHLSAMAILYQGMALSFPLAQSISTVLAMTFNFFINNMITFWDRKLRGWGLLSGWLSFVLVCSVGAVANVGVATWLFQSGNAWLLPSLAGILVGAVWNYAVTTIYTWNHKST